MSLPAGAAIQFLLPQRLSCRIVYRLSRSRRPWLKRLLIANFLKLYDVDMREAAVEDPQAYPTFNEFFTRPLKAGARPLADDATSMPGLADAARRAIAELNAPPVVAAPAAPAAPPPPPTPAPDTRPRYLSMQMVEDVLRPSERKLRACLREHGNDRPAVRISMVVDGKGVIEF